MQPVSGHNAGHNAGQNADHHAPAAVMGKGRLEAFSDGVIAIIITIMVLELKVPHGDTLADLLLVLGHARKTLRVVRQNLAWAAAYNAVCVPLAVVGWMPPWLAGLGMAGSSLAVVFNAARLATLPSLNTHQHETA